MSLRNDRKICQRLEMTLVGVIEAAVTYSLGLAFGALG